MTPGSFIHVGGLHDEPGIVSNGVKKLPIARFSLLKAPYPR
jgi:hypothetical protein